METGLNGDHGVFAVRIIISADLAKIPGQDRAQILLHNSVVSIALGTIPKLGTAMQLCAVCHSKFVEIFHIFLI